MRPQITVLDLGGQYCHLIARKVRDAGVYAEVAPAGTPASGLTGSKGIIISGGPSSVYDPASPTIDPAVLDLGIPVLGICYGQQLITHLLGGKVQKGDRGEYGFAQMTVIEPGELLAGIDTIAELPLAQAATTQNSALGSATPGDRQGPAGNQPRHQVWMSHRDTVQTPPPGFTTLAATPTCPVAAIANPSRRLYAVQFHPEVAHTPSGNRILANFLFRICGAEKDWDPAGQIAAVEQQIRDAAGDRNVFFFVSGGVDSTVAFTLCLKALGPERVHGTYVDTGLMREGETDFVRQSFESLIDQERSTATGRKPFEVEDAREQFLNALAGITQPEAKRHAIGEEFVRVQQRILESDHYLDGNWILGQGTIYPDTIESGGTAQADLIKTHHNRVAGIQKLIDEGRIVEPLTSFYKDEVRSVGRQLDLPDALLDRHPFPGPGLGIRCLCGTETGAARETPHGWILPFRSVGVQGDSRTYRAALAIPEFPESDEAAANLVNELEEVNRVVVEVWAAAPIGQLTTRPAHLTQQRLHLLRRADAIVRQLSLDSCFDSRVWQFPVVLAPFGTIDDPDSVILRPIDSVDGMTASVVRMPPELLEQIVQELSALDGIGAIFYDLTNKPPGTIEWE